MLLLWMFASYAALPRTTDQTSWRMFLLGAIGAALFFTKINVGVFYLAALATAIICLIKRGWIRLLGVSLSIVYAVTAPYILMHSLNLSSRGVVAYCLLVTLCGASTFVLGSLIRSANPHSASTLLYAGTGLLAATSFIVIAGWLQGISLATLVEGVLLYPMKYHQMFYMLWQIGMRVVLFSAIIILGILCTWLWQQRQGNIRVAAGIDAVRCAVGFGTCLTIIIDLDRAHWFLAFLPLSLIPGVRSFSTSELFPRLFLTNLAATEFLVTYPVAGSQVPLATSLHLLWAFLCIADGLGGLNEAWKQSNWMVRRQFRLGLVVPSVLLIITAANAAVGVTLRDLPPRSTLNGSSLLHLRPDQELDYKFLSRNIAANCSILFTMPGMGSFNFWSGVPTPNGSNVSAWMKLLDAERQQQILDRLQSTRGACVVYNPGLMRLWDIRQEEILALPLAQYILTAMPKAITRGGYEIRIHPNRGSPWRAPEVLSLRGGHGYKFWISAAQKVSFLKAGQSLTSLASALPDSSED